MKITVFQQAPDLGGSEIFMANLIGEWKQIGDDIVVFTNYQEYKNLLDRKGARIDHLPLILDIVGNTRGFVKTFFLLPYALFWYNNKLKKLASLTDVIIVSGLTEKLLVTWIAHFYHLPVIWFEYPPLQKLLARNFSIPKILYKYCSNLPKSILVISKNTRKSLIEKIGIQKSKIRLVYPGVPLPNLQQRKLFQKEAIRLKKKLTINNKKVVGIISRVAKEKGQEILIQILPQIQSRIPEAVIVIAGRGPDLPRLQLLARRQHLEDDVYFLGFVGNPYSIFAMMDVFVFTGTWELEGFGLVLAEAMVMQKPVVAFRYGPVPEIITNKRNGVLVEPGDSKALTESIIEILIDNKQLKKYAVNAYRTACSRFDIKKTATLTRKIILSAIGNEKI